MAEQERSSDIPLLALSNSLSQTYGRMHSISGKPILQGFGGKNYVCSRCGTTIIESADEFPPMLNASALCPRCNVYLHLTKATRYSEQVPMLADKSSKFNPPSIMLNISNSYKRAEFAKEIGVVADELIADIVNNHTKLPRILYHYTSQDAFSAIITSGTIWASDVAYLNDSTELTYAIDIINQVIDDMTRDSDGLLKELVRRGREIHATPDTTGSGYLATCFCVDGDLLSQWRAYGDGGKGIALGFNASEFTARQLIVRKVIYDPEVQRSLVSNIIAKFTNLLTKSFPDKSVADVDEHNVLMVLSMLLNELLIEHSFTFKHPSFSEENEWRIITPYSRDSHLDRIGLRSSGPFLIPFSSLRFGDGHTSPPLPLLEIVHGPTLHPELMRKSMHLAIEKSGYEHVEVRGSSTPLRV